MFRSLLTAFSILTVLPLPKGFMPSENELKHASTFFPVAGLFLGILDLLLAAFFFRYLPVLPAAALMTVIPELENRGFHWDGLADTGDGFFSSRSKEKILEIMHDSRIGSMGVLALVGYALLKFSLLAAMPERLFPAACGFAALAGRTSMTFALCMGRYARNEGLAKLFFERRPWDGVLLGLILCVSADILLTGRCFHLLPCLIFVPVWYQICRNRIGGQTGDTLGACMELSTVVALFSFLTGIPT